MSAELALPRLDVERLSATSRGRVLLPPVSFSARAGTLLWVTGENGAGKSTLLRVLAGRAPADGRVRFHPQFDPADVCFYCPEMGVPPNASVRAWLRLNEQIAPPATVAALSADDALLPTVSSRKQMTRLSTGEAKRLLLWSLLRAPKPFTLLDEPYEHLSPGAKGRLTEILVERSLVSVVIVATNQDVPAHGDKHILTIA